MLGIPASATQSATLFLLIGAGFAAGKCGVLKGDTIKALSRFLLDFTLPALIVSSMQTPFSVALRDQAFRVLGLSLLVYGTAFPLAYGLSALYRGADAAEKGVHRFAMCFSNVSFMGFPVAQSILGKESLFLVSVYNIPFQLLAFSVGAAMIARGAGTRGPAKALVPSLKSLLNPAVLAALLGFALFMFGLRVPEPVRGALQLLGGATTPLAMALIGATLAGASLGRVFLNPRIWATIAWRLAVHPFVVMGLAYAFGARGLELAVPVLIASMPVAANTTILASVYDGDSVSAGALVFASTLISLLSIPLVSGILA